MSHCCAAGARAARSDWSRSALARLRLPAARKVVALHSVGVLAVLGCAVQWRCLSALAGCVGVVAPGESLASARRPAATAPVGVVILLGGVVGDGTSSTPGSRSSGESQDPALGSGGDVVFSVASPLKGTVLMILVSLVLPTGWTCTAVQSAGYGR